MDLYGYSLTRKFEDLLLSKFKNTKTLFNQTQTKPQKKLGFILSTSKEAIFNTPIESEGDWLIRLTGLDVINSVFNITIERKTSFKKLISKTETRLLC